MHRGPENFKMCSKINKELFEYFEFDENNNFKLITNWSSNSSQEIEKFKKLPTPKNKTLISLSSSSESI